MFLLQICSVLFLFQVKCYASLCQSIHAFFVPSPSSPGPVCWLLFWAFAYNKGFLPFTYVCWPDAHILSPFSHFWPIFKHVVFQWSLLSRSNWPRAPTGLFTVVSQNLGDDSWFLVKFSKCLLKEWRDQVAASWWWCPPSHHCSLLGWRTRDSIARAAPELCSKSTNSHL